MTLEEAKSVARISITADGGCSFCVGHLFDQLNEKFPQFYWEVIDSYLGEDSPDDERFTVKPR